MNIVEELQSLDINEPGRWPLPFRIAAAVLVFRARRQEMRSEA